MVLKPLEFADCLTDSPYFRAKLSEHEKELERTSKFIKTLIQHGREVYSAAKQFTKAQKAFAKDLIEFKFECIGNQLTDDEVLISQSLNEFGRYIEKIEEHRDILISSAEDQLVKPLETFRKENIGAAKEEKKNFDKQTTKFCQSQERYLNMKTKINDSVLQEADTQVEFEKKAFYTSSMKYVLKLQEVQEKKKFEFVEILLTHMVSWLTFYHQGYVDLEEFRKYDLMLRQLLQKTRENFECTRNEASMLMSKMLNENKGLLYAAQMKPLDQSSTLKGFTRQGYLYVMEKRVMGTTSWTKYYCQYRKESKEFYMILYNQIGGKLSEPEQFILENCVRRASDSIEKRFCFDITFKGKSVMTFQALSEDDRRLWMDAMDGKEPTYTMHNIKKKDDSILDDVGFLFMRRSIEAIETRGLHEQGLYRVVGVTSKVNAFIKLALDPKKTDKINYDDPSVYETKTVTSAVKNYLRTLPEPLMTFKLHDNFIKAAKQDSKTLRILDVHKYVHQLPESNFEMLDILISHLRNNNVCLQASTSSVSSFVNPPVTTVRQDQPSCSLDSSVSEQSEINKMTVANLGVCFGPSLMRPEEETMAAIMDIKFCNLVVEILINNYIQIFKHPPDGADLSESRVLPTKDQPPLRYDTDSHSRSSMAPLGPKPPGTPISRHYANQAPVHPNAAATKSKLRPMFNANAGGYDMHNSVSGSSESLNSSKSIVSPRGALPSGSVTPGSEKSRRGSNNSEINALYSNVTALASRFNLNFPGGETPTFGSVKKRSSSDFSSQGAMSTSMQGSLSGSISSLSGSTGKPPRRKVITRYRCVADSDMELSFEANQIITNVRPSREPGWLEGTLDGKTGIIPENYVEYIQD